MKPIFHLIFKLYFPVSPCFPSFRWRNCKQITKYEVEWNKLSREQSIGNRLGSAVGRSVIPNKYGRKGRAVLAMDVCRWMGRKNLSLIFESIFYFWQDSNFFIADHKKLHAFHSCCVMTHHLGCGSLSELFVKKAIKPLALKIIITLQIR